MLAAFAFYSVNLLLISLVVAVSAHKPFTTVTRTSIQATGMPFALMASAALMLVILWQRSPLLSGALVGPLLAIALYQRSTFRELRAMRLALTDPLTGLGNHRHFHDRLERELADSQAQDYPLSLCLVDIDEFKRINDRFGHPVGDKVLAQLATNLRQGGEAFRLGGDEFAILLPGRDEDGARIAADAIIERISSVELPPAGSVTVSAGIATAPLDDVGRDELVRRADSALYWAKEYGKNQTRVYRPDVVEIAELKRLAAGPDRAARFRAAASLAKAVDARDAYTGSHSERVSDLAARIATRLGVDREQVELTSSPRACTTSASSRSRRRSCASPARSPRPSGSCSNVIPRSATGCSRASASTPSPTGCCTTTSAGTAPATPMRSAATTSPSAPGSSSSRTPTTR